MAYVNSIPTITQEFQYTAPIIQNNWVEIQNLLIVNHVGFDQTGSGKHAVVDMPPRSAPSFLPGDAQLFNWGGAYAPTTENELTLRRTTAAGNNVVTIAASILSYSNPLPAVNTEGWTCLPSGIILKWGAIEFDAGGYQPVVFPVDAKIVPFATCLAVIATPFYIGSGNIDVNVSVAVNASSVSPTGFSVYCASRTTTGAYPGTPNIYYLAIGY